MGIYETMSNDEIKRVIAERVGWHIVQHGGLWMVIEPRYTEADVHTFAEKDHERWGRYGHKTAEDAWRHELRLTPDWLENTDNALELFGENAADWALLRTHDKYNFAYGNGFDGVADTVENRMVMPSNWDWYTTPARAICIAWLEWQDRN